MKERGQSIQLAERGTYFVRNMEFIDQVEVEEHSQDNLESLAVMVLGVIEFITKQSNV